MSSSSTATLRTPPELVRPGWPEIVTAAVVYGLAYWLTPVVADQVGQSEATQGLVLAAWSGVMGLAAFFAAYLIRLRSFPAFGFRRISPRWILAAVGFGFVAVVLVQLVSIVVALILGPGVGDVQSGYRAASSTGPIGLILQLLFIAVLTPLGEELAFRGVLANALFRYGPWVGGIISTVVFAVVHTNLFEFPSPNLVLIPSAIVGGINAFLFYRTKSIWPGIIVHAVSNSAFTLLGLVG
jgi:uncharacterized protein